jgi:hypothetical protein
MYNLYAQFPRQQICRDRQYSALLRWAAYYGALPPPTEKPPEADVEARITAAKVTLNTDFYVTMTLPMTVGQPNVQTDIRKHLNSFNDDATETTLDAQLDTVLGVIMPKFAHVHITQAEIDNWYLENGFVEEPAAAAGPQVNLPPFSELMPAPPPL